MGQEKVIQVLEDKDFIEKIVRLQTPEEVQSAFKEKGIDTSIKEVELLGSLINKMIEKKGGNLTEEDLESISGGGPVEMVAGHTLGALVGTLAGAFQTVAGVPMMILYGDRAAKEKGFRVGYVLSRVALAAAGAGMGVGYLKWSGKNKKTS